MINRRSFLGLLAGTAAAAAAAPLLAKIAPAVEPEQVRRLLTQLRGGMVQQWILPLGQPTLIRPGGVERFEAFSLRLFRPERLMVGGDPSGFDILNVSASGEPQMDERIPADYFSPRAYGTRLQFAAVAPGDTIVMAVHNRSKQPGVFQAAMIGVVPMTPEEEAHQAELAAAYDAAAEYEDEDEDDGEDWDEDTDPDRVVED
jgi:hypothetical protein